MGTGPEPKDGQEVTFHYTAYNESGGRIDTSFKQGKPSVTRLGIKGLIPGACLGVLLCACVLWQPLNAWDTCRL